MEILNKGDFQVSDLEREGQLDNLRKEVAHIIVDMCVNSKNLRPFPINQILQAMSQCKVKINERDSAKKQALEIIPELEKVISIKRAQMRVLASFCSKELLVRFKTEMQNAGNG